MRAPIKQQTMCEELLALQRDAVLALRRIKQIRRSRDLSFFEDADLNCEKHAWLHRVLKHLLVGHQGQPCPAGNRPIVSPAAVPRWARPPARPSPRLPASPGSLIRKSAAQIMGDRVANTSRKVAAQCPVHQSAPAWPLRLVRFFRGAPMESNV